MNDQKTLIEDLMNESGLATISQLKERVALLESSRAKEAETASAMIGLEKAARNELERFKEDWLVLRSELGELDRENKNLRADLERVQPFVALLWEASASKPSTADWAFCPRCGGSLDTGWECVKCGADWR